MKGITDKIDFGFLLNNLNFVGEGAEIGCSNCCNAMNIRAKWNSGVLWLIDPWVSQPVGEYKERQESPKRYEDWWRECSQFVELHPGSVKIIRDYSANSAPQFADGQLDWVYIDANHDFKHFSEDLNLWYPKVKVGGLMSGHDYYDAVDSPTGSGYYNEVKSALDKWAGERGIEFENWRCSSWAFIKK